jgi:glycosyltransferase involved in cell wall biosynthesis
VTFTGRVAHDVIPQYIAAFDIGVSPRATFYASPMKVPEYMASGVPVIAPRTPNLQDLVTEGADGELFTAEDIDELTSALTRLTVNEGYRLRLGRAARASIVTGRTWRHNADRIAAIGGELAAARRPRLASPAKLSPEPTTTR